jgi:hypothetical protein
MRWDSDETKVVALVAARADAEQSAGAPQGIDPGGTATIAGGALVRAGSVSKAGGCPEGQDGARVLGAIPLIFSTLARQTSPWGRLQESRSCLKITPVSDFGRIER